MPKAPRGHATQITLRPCNAECAQTAHNTNRTSSAAGRHGNIHAVALAYVQLCAQQDENGRHGQFDKLFPRHLPTAPLAKHLSRFPLAGPRRGARGVARSVYVVKKA